MVKTLQSQLGKLGQRMHPQGLQEMKGSYIFIALPI